MIMSKTCPDCHGSGYDYGDGGQYERCGGTGEIPDDEDDQLVKPVFIKI